MDLNTRQVDIWRTFLDIDSERVDALKNLLSPDELARADRYVFAIHRHRFIAARATLRRILSSYTGTGPEAIRFHYGLRGKPAIAFPEAGGLFFNLSHSENLALVGVTRIAEIGVDIERIREVPESRIVERFFSPAEIAAFATVPPRDQIAAFFRCWTRKEAFIKARGEGLSIALDSFDVSLEKGRASSLLRVGTDVGETALWTIQDLTVPEEYQAAVALRTTDFQIRYQETLLSDAF